MSSDGALYMLDKFGIVWKSANGGTPERVIHLGAGRPLGFHFDKDDNLVICNAGVVGDPIFNAVKLLHIEVHL